MSFDRNEVRRLEATGGAVLARYRALVAAADASAYDSPAARAKAEFERDWAADPETVKRIVAAEARAQAPVPGRDPHLHR
jgi:hypothetical protein